MDEHGGNDEDCKLKKYRRDFKLAVYNVNYGGELKSCPDACFSICILIGLYYLKKTKGWELLSIRKKKIEEVLNEDKILQFYEQIGMGQKSCVIFGHDFPVYEKFLKNKNVDLVVFSLKCENTIVYDSRTDETGRLV